MAGWWWWWWKGGWCSWYDGGGRRPGPVCVRMRGLLSPGWKLTAVSPTRALAGVLRWRGGSEAGSEAAPPGNRWSEVG